MFNDIEKKQILLYGDSRVSESYVASGDYDLISKGHLDTQLDLKSDLVADAVANQILLTDADGQPIVSGKSFNDSGSTVNDIWSANKVASEISSAVTGLVDLRGEYDASGDVFPTAGGSGTAGAVLKGDIWYISVAGTLGSKDVEPGDAIIANTDTPGQTEGNWIVIESNFGYTPENITNKTDDVKTNEASSTKYASAKGVADAIKTGTYTMSNKTIDADNNTISNIENDNIKASAGIVYSKLSIADADLTIAKTSGLQTALNSKAALISSPTNGNIVTTNASGQSVDSGKSFNDEGTGANDILSAQEVDTRISENGSFVLLKKVINYNSSSPVAIGNIPAGYIAREASVRSKTEFDVSATLEIGISGDTDLLLSSSEIGDLEDYNSSEGTFQNFNGLYNGADGSDITFGSSTELIATLGITGGTAGSIEVLVRCYAN